MFKSALTGTKQKRVNKVTELDDFYLQGDVFSPAFFVGWFVGRITKLG